MKTLAQQMAFYSAYHRDGRNRATHFVGVPAIAFSLMIPTAWLRLDFGPFEISLAMAFVAAVLAYYLALDVALAIALAVVFAPLLALAEYLAAQGAVVGWTAFGVCFVGGWILQLIGHAFEGRRPALVDNFWQIFVAPLFLMAEAFFALGLKREVRDEVERLYPRHLPDGPGEERGARA